MRFFFFFVNFFGVVYVVWKTPQKYKNEKTRRIRKPYSGKNCLNAPSSMRVSLESSGSAPGMFGYFLNIPTWSIIGQAEESPGRTRGIFLYRRKCFLPLIRVTMFRETRFDEKHMTIIIENTWKRRRAPEYFLISISICFVTKVAVTRWNELLQVYVGLSQVSVGRLAIYCLVSSKKTKMITFFVTSLARVFSFVFIMIFFALPPSRANVLVQAHNSSVFTFHPFALVFFVFGKKAHFCCHTSGFILHILSFLCSSIPGLRVLCPVRHLAINLSELGRRVQQEFRNM